ncbi:MAG: hypothetical protein OEY94_02295 [Alphaproteobacteria bacterium]|nr:hypothetical protein [Alphaproteobacteria bacterium]
MTFHQKFLTTLSFCSILALASCGYAVEQSNQMVEIITPGAENARCEVWVDKIRYQIHPPQKMNIMKSENDMVLDCIAPGNRRLKMSVPAKFESKAIWGTPAGMAWDYASKSLHYYPDVIAVDFSKEPIVENTLPKHNSPDIKQPEAYDLEEFSPGYPHLNKDKHIQPYKIKKRGEADAEVIQEPEYNEGVMSAAPPTEEKGSLMSILERLGDEGNGDTVQEISPDAGETAIVPSVEAGEAVSGPTPLFDE